MNDDITLRLENMVVPTAIPADFKTGLRSELINEYSRMSESPAGVFGFFTSRRLVWRTVFMTSAAWIVVLFVVIFGFSVLEIQSDSAAAKVIDTVMASPEVKSLLSGDETSMISLTEIGENEFEVLVESKGGRIISARVSAVDDSIRIIEISYLIMMGSPYEPDKPVTGDELENVINLGKTSPAFRKLIDDGAKVEEAIYIKCLVTKRNVIANEKTTSDEMWMMLTLTHGDKTCYFMINPDTYRVIDRGCR